MDEADPHGPRLAPSKGMRFVALIIVVAIIYMAMSKHANHSSSEVNEAIATVDASLPQKPAPAAAAPAAGGGAPAQGNYLRAMDRARSVVGEVHRQQNQ